MRATEKDYYVYYLSVKYTCITRYEYCSCKSWAIEFWHENSHVGQAGQFAIVALKRLEFCLLLWWACTIPGLAYN